MYINQKHLIVLVNNVLPWKLDQRMLPRTTKKNTITYTPTGRLYKCCCFNDHVPMVLGFNPNGLPLFFLFPPCLLVVGWPLQDCLLLPKKNPVDLYIKEIYLACGWLVIKVMVSAQVRIFSASASGISIANSSSTAIRTSTWSSESKPRSST